MTAPEARAANGPAGRRLPNEERRRPQKVPAAPPIRGCVAWSYGSSATATSLIRPFECAVTFLRYST
jgi:hypothetical protein